MNPRSLLPGIRLEITFDCNFGNEFGTIRNVPGSLGVVRQGRQHTNSRDDTRESFPFGGDTEKRKAGWWVEVVKALLENELTRLQI